MARRHDRRRRRQRRDRREPTTRSDVPSDNTIRFRRRWVLRTRGGPVFEMAFGHQVEHDRDLGLGFVQVEEIKTGLKS